MVPLRSVAASCAAVLALLAFVRADGASSRPALVVILVIDQFRTQYLDRYAPQWTGGLRRLIGEGAWFRNAAFPYLNTVTCAGHATLSTGAVPAVHGMILNEWWDRSAQRPVTCTDDGRASAISLGAAPPVAHGSGRLAVPTLADELRAQLQPASRVVSVSMKARSALMMAGQRGGDVVLWFENGVWMSPAPGPASAAPTVAEWLRAHPVHADGGRVWTRSLPHDRYVNDDDPKGKQPLAGWGTSLPHALGSDRDAGFIARWEHSPFSDEYLARLAGHVLSELELGRRDSVDYLAVSFSALDRIGHKMGPDSHEVQDAIVRLDRTIGALLEQIDSQTQGRFVAALSSDHGVSGVPEQLQASGADAGRTRSADVAQRVDAALGRVLGPGRYVARVFYTDLYFAPGVYDRLRANPAALRAAVDAAASAPGVAKVFRAEEVVDQRQAKDPLLRAAANSYFSARSGDLILVPHANWIFSTAAATHGSANPYDVDVPVVLMGQGVRRGIHLNEATPADIAPTLASLAGVKLPHATGRVLHEALDRPPEHVTGRGDPAEGSRRLR